MSLKLSTSHFMKSVLRLTLNRFVFAEGRVIYAADFEEAEAIFRSGL